MRNALERSRPREIAQGFTVVGPHRDDLLMLLDGLDVGSTASRGQCRTLVLALKLAEASFLLDERGQEPVLLLDDILSELDASRRARVLDRAGPLPAVLPDGRDAGVRRPSPHRPHVQVQRGGRQGIAVRVRSGAVIGCP